MGHQIIRRLFQAGESAGVGVMGVSMFLLVPGFPSLKCVFVTATPYTTLR